MQASLPSKSCLLHVISFLITTKVQHSAVLKKNNFTIYSHLFRSIEVDQQLFSIRRVSPLLRLTHLQKQQQKSIYKIDPTSSAT